VATKSIISEILQKHEGEILAEWLNLLKGGRGRTGRLKEGELETQARQVLGALRIAAQGGVDSDIATEPYAALREILDSISRSRALQSYTPSETATFVLSLKEPIFNREVDRRCSVASPGGLVPDRVDRPAGAIHGRCFPADARRGDQAPAGGTG
jgi:RsbT co-antagonist protein rsbRD N-terminal domain